MDNIKLNIIEINREQYILVDTLRNEPNSYYYFSNIKDSKDVKVLKDKEDIDGEYFVSLDSDIERDYALSLFYEKYRNNEF